MAVNINVPSQVKTYANLAAFPASGALKTIYIAEDTNKLIVGQAAFMSKFQQQEHQA
jgi:hypothetical protein